MEAKRKVESLKKALDVITCVLSLHLTHGKYQGEIYKLKLLNTTKHRTQTKVNMILPMLNIISILCRVEAEPEEHSI